MAKKKKKVETSSPLDVWWGTKDRTEEIGARMVTSRASLSFPRKRREQACQRDSERLDPGRGTRRPRGWGTHGEARGAADDVLAARGATLTAAREPPQPRGQHHAPHRLRQRTGPRAAEPSGRGGPQAAGSGSSRKLAPRRPHPDFRTVPW